MGNKSMWLVAAFGACLVAPVLAQDARQGAFQLTPYVGRAHLRVNGSNLEFGETDRIDAMALGFAMAYRTSFGLVTELGLTTTSEDNFPFPLFELSTNESYLGVGYQFDFAKTWYFTPKIGFSRWHLESDLFEEVIDDDGVEQESLEGDSWFIELGLMHEFNDRAALGLKLRDTEVSFGQMRSATVAFTWSF